MASHRPPAATSPEAPLTVPAVAPKVEAESPSEARNPTSLGCPPSPEMEATAEALTREEVLRRRRRRTARLFGVYRRMYWAMAEEVRARHRQYVWELGRSPLEAEQPPSADGAEVKPGPAAVPRRKKCGFTGCKVRAMAMAKYCHSHILADPSQSLYKGCAFIMRSGAQIGQITCSRPILKASVPSLCNVHLIRSQKHIVQAYKKVGFNPPSSGKISPDFSLLVAECVRQIQQKRRESQSAPAR